MSRLRSNKDYKVLNELNGGQYSVVYTCIILSTNITLNGTRCVMKELKPVEAVKIKREIYTLKALEGGENIIKLIDVIQNDKTRITSLIFEYINNIPFKKLYTLMNDTDIRSYMYQVLKGLDFSHRQKSIMHRDIKPHNILFDCDTKSVKVIDWGLAEFYQPGHKYNVRVSTQSYKAPELLIENQYYDYAIDMWSFGALFAGIIFKKIPFFPGQNLTDQLLVIANVLGTNDLFLYLKNHNLSLPHKFNGLLRKDDIHNKILRKPWSYFMNEFNRHVVTNDAIDLVSKILRYDPSERLTASEALLHSYFNPIRASFQQHSDTNPFIHTHTHSNTNTAMFYGWSKVVSESVKFSRLQLYNTGQVASSIISATSLNIPNSIVIVCSILVYFYLYKYSRTKKSTKGSN